MPHFLTNLLVFYDIDGLKWYLGYRHTYSHQGISNHGQRILTKFTYIPAVRGLM